MPADTLRKFNQVHEIDQKIVSEFKRVAGDIKFGIPTGNAILEILGKETGAYTAV